MKRILFLFIFTSLQAHFMQLEHYIIHTIDNRYPGLDPEGIGMVKKYQANIMSMRLGKPTREGVRKGW